MLISTKGRYALRVLVDMAEHQTADFVPLKDIARRQDISEKYLESIVKLLVKGGVLEGQRGKGGGYRLMDPPERYRVGDVLRLCEGTLAPVSCLAEGAKPCPRMPDCRTFPVWQGLDRVISEYLDRYTLADLMKAEGGNDYVI